MSNYAWNDREDGWHAEQMPCLPPDRIPLLDLIPCCEDCEQIAERRILTPRGLLCDVCGEKYIEAQRKRALEMVEREMAIFRSRREAFARMQEE